MSKYDDLFEDATPTESVFTDKGALDPLADPEEIVSRETQEEALARILSGVYEGYLPTTVSVYGPPGTGKTMTTQRVCREFAARNETVAVEYVNLKECRTLFSVANEILRALTGEKKKSYEGLDGVFEGIWNALEEYPQYTILLLDEIDQIKHDSNYDPNEFFYRLLRGEGKLSRGISLSVWLLSNELLDVDLRLDSRVESAMSDEAVFFPPYSAAELATILEPSIERAFQEDALSNETFENGTRMAANRWGDARKALTLFRQAGETANARGLTRVTDECLETNIENAERESVLEKLTQLPQSHFLVLAALTSRRRDGEVVQPVETAQIEQTLQREDIPADSRLGTRTIRKVLTNLETIGLIETWVESRGRGGRSKQVETTFDPEWMMDLGSE
ncbi:Cdc6/Cdc18 family protein [Halococcus sp. IIIV-5B]|uniref:Cdc6/Cdc18 family protein n=1 Tax=Halococcus sp. IIIV-5B TaxID=2321230 RepID=UPI000E71B659|nr:AAA family ATPase [Halococcus sp. IIIV-5B]RJT07999.1 AAA family ATPase [Halococcus sp. IIIV-5B]